MNVGRLRTLSVEIYKTLNDLNPSFMNNTGWAKKNVPRIHFCITKVKNKF